MTPLFSIVIVNYNHGQFLEEAIKSVLNQSSSDYELILVDGGSTDNSLAVIEKYKSVFSWYVSEKDKGQSDAFNKGFKQAKGKFFFWLNADDILLPNTIQKAKEFLSHNPDCKWLAGNTITMNNSRYVQWCIKGPLFVKFLVRYGNVYVYGPTSFFHRELLERVGGFDESLHYTMDTDLWFRFVNAGYRFMRLNHYCWGLRIHEASKTSHAFYGQSNEKFAKEKQYIESKNNHRIYKSINMMQSAWKLLTGCFFVKWYDNYRLAGKVI